jgi:tetratricopeptide (TPR) repeat protein
MASASSKTQLAVALWLLPALAWAGPALSGAYRSEPLGRMELATEGDRLTGVTASANACNFASGTRMLEGAFEDSVLVGTVTLCQTGNGCASEQAYPLLAVYNPADGSLSAHVKLRQGCQSPAVLKNGRLVWMPAGAEEASLEETPGGKRGPLRLSQERVTATLRQAGTLFNQGDYVAAAEHFQAVVDHDANNALAHHGLGGSLFFQKRGLERRAIEELKKARRLDGRNPATPFLMAVAYGRLGEKKQGLIHLRQAMKLGYSVDAALWSRDTDLRNLLGSEEEFQAFLKHAPGAKQAQTRERPTPSDP